MNSATRVGIYAAGLAVVFGGALGAAVALSALAVQALTGQT